MFSKKIKEEAKNYIKKFCNDNTKEINLRKLRKDGFKQSNDKSKNAEVGNKIKDLPGLVESSSESSVEQ